MTPLSALRTALTGLITNPLRAALTALGLIIGVASVIVMLALGNGARAAVEANFRFLGSNQLEISARYKTEDGALVPAGKILSYEDGLQLPAAVDLVASVEMRVQGHAKLRHGRQTVEPPLYGVTTDALRTLAVRSGLQPAHWPPGQPIVPESFLARGCFFTPAEVAEGAEVCVLGSETAEELFTGDDPVGEVVWVGRQRCLVIGVLTELETADPANRERTKPNELFLLPISTAIHFLYEEEPSVTITADVRDEKRMEEALSQITNYLRQRHDVQPDAAGQYEDDFVMTSRREILGAQQDSARTFAFFLAAMAVVSLVVGGIGIMNVMLVSVTERTQEIGIRLAVGARPRDVIAQFLLEAVLLSAGGGILGIASGILLIPLAALFNAGQALLAPGSIPLAFSVAVLTGILFGLYPALRAARLDPLAALRYE